MRRVLLAFILTAPVLVGCEVNNPCPDNYRRSGTITTTEPGQVIEDVCVTGQIRLMHPNARVRRVTVYSDGGMAVYVDPDTGGGAIISDFLLDGSAGISSEPAVGYARYQLHRGQIRGFGEGPMANGDVWIDRVAMYDFDLDPGEGWHQDGVQVVCNDHIAITNSIILMNPDDANAAIMVGTACGPVDDVLIEGNLLAGGGWTVYGGSDENWPGPNATNVRILDNQFSTAYHPKGGFHGPLTNVWRATVEGNRYCASRPDDNLPDIAGCDGPLAGQPVG